MAQEFHIEFAPRTAVHVEDAEPLGAVQVLVERVAGNPTQEQINIAVAEYIEEHPGAAFGISEEVKQALLQIAEKVVYIDEHGQDYYDALYAALYPPTELVSITAVYTQSGTVTTTDTLDSLKDDLVVTALYTDASTEVIPAADYTLSGTLTVGTSTITVTYGGKTDTFDVTVTNPLIYNWDFGTSLTDTIGGVTATLLNGATQTSDGIVIDADTEEVNIADVLGFNRTIEMDVTNVTYSAGNHTALFFHLWNGTDDPPSGYYSSFGYRYHSTASNRRIGIITTKTNSWSYSGYTATFLDSITADGQVATLRFVISDTGNYTVYLNGENMNITGQGITNENSIKAIKIGAHTNGTYVSFRNMTVKALRIYGEAMYY